MVRKLLLVAAVLTLAACQMAPRAQVGADGNAIPVAYRISPRDAAVIPDRVLQQVNLLRSQSGLGPMTLSPQLAAAATAHSRDMSAQNRAWHFGSDGSSPLDRVRRQGYAGNLVGEDISETYENEIATLGAWMQTRDTRDMLMDPNAREMGLGWFQEPSNKIWWTVVIGG
ncbi:MAG: serine protease [Paracoccus denitrificans]|nr:MAG: serine protease [Paracoccus denitrificans]PZO85911.1 MAG: serine protease [Paracoccus denitrificans]